MTTDMTAKQMASAAGAVLGRLGRGRSKNYTAEERQKRRDRMLGVLAKIKAEKAAKQEV